jgi:hypothetical protein
MSGECRKIGNKRKCQISKFRRGGKIHIHPHPDPLPPREREYFLKEFESWENLRLLKFWNPEF